MNRAAAKRRLWPAERGLWLIVGLPWAAGLASGPAPAAAGLLAAALFCGVVAREPLMWSLWRRLRGFGPRADWWSATLWAVAGCALAGVWWSLSPAAAPRIGLSLVALAAAWDGGMRLWNARLWWPGVAGAAATAAGTYLAARGGAALGPVSLVVAMVLAYAAGASMCAMGLFVSRVSGAPRAGMLLWLWTAGGGVPLTVAGLAAGALPVSALALGMGLLHAEMACQQERSLDFRRLGWREATWLATVTALVLWAGGRVTAP